ncbi:MAG: PTS sugar transporter subunit IIC [Lachnospira sp.]|nr:PTS sugar transporter subunit IIC [Lachnospira sp.]
MKKIKYYLNDIFVEGMTGMASGLFATLIMGTILAQIGVLIGGVVGEYINLAASVAKTLTGAGIGVGMAYRFKESVLTTVAAGICGMTGAYAGQMIAGSFVVDGLIHISGPGEPLGAFIAAYVGIKCGHLVAGKTKLDIIITPFVTIVPGAFIGFLVGPPISSFMSALGGLIMWATERQPLLMGIVVSVLMGMILTLPISSAALGVILNLSGIAAGAATVGCCCNMVGFAVVSFRENGWGGLFAQGIGTSMLQVPNIMRKPIIWLPAIISSAILGPVSTVILGMTNNATGSGMGSAGLVGQIMTYQTMVSEGFHGIMVLIDIIVMHFIAPAILAFIISEFMRKRKWIKEGDMKLDI